MTESTLRRLTTIVQIQFSLMATTGLHIGGTEESIGIGGLDNPVVRDPLSGQPYIPGSSLKGKMRSLLERVHGLDQNWPIQTGRVFIHARAESDHYASCMHCQLFGVPAPEHERWFCQTRLRVSDVFLTYEAAEQLRIANTALPYTELKSEAAIDRVSAAAVPRVIERVPARARFGPSEIAVFVFEGDQIEALLDHLIQGLELLEADYLGGSGARGSGRVHFEDLRVNTLRFPDESFTTEHESFPTSFAGARDLRSGLGQVVTWLNQVR